MMYGCQIVVLKLCAICSGTPCRIKIYLDMFLLLFESYLTSYIAGTGGSSDCLMSALLYARSVGLSPTRLTLFCSDVSKLMNELFDGLPKSVLSWVNMPHFPITAA